MEMLVIVFVAVIAFTAVLVPLFRRAGDGSEFSADNPPPADSAAAAGSTTRHAAGTSHDRPHAGTQQDADETHDADSPYADTPRDAAMQDADSPYAGTPRDADELELEVQRYRVAVRAGTVCRKCGQANPADSTFCFDCGARLPRDDAKEFE